MRPLLGPPREPASTYQSKRFQDVSDAAGDSPNSPPSEASCCSPFQTPALRLDGGNMAFPPCIVSSGFGQDQAQLDLSDRAPPTSSQEGTLALPNTARDPGSIGQWPDVVGT